MTSRREFFARLAAGPLLVMHAAPAADQPGSILLSKPRIGAEFFLNNSETRDSVFRHFRMMNQTGFTVARIFTIWDQIEREKGKWDFTGYDWIYDAAAAERHSNRQYALLGRSSRMDGYGTVLPSVGRPLESTASAVLGNLHRKSREPLQEPPGARRVAFAK